MSNHTDRSIIAYIREARDDVYCETKLLSGVIIQNKYRRPYQNTRDFRNNKRLTRVEELILKTNIIWEGEKE